MSNQCDPQPASSAHINQKQPMSQALAVEELKNLEDALFWEEEAKQWWQSAQATWKKKADELSLKKSVDRKLQTSIAISSLLVFITLSSLIFIIQHGEYEKRQQEIKVQVGSLPDAIASMRILQTRFRLSGDDLWQRVKERQDLTDLYRKRWLNSDDPLDSDVVLEVVEKGYFSGEQSASLTGAMLFALDTIAPNHKRYKEVRTRIINDLRKKHPLPPLVDLDWILLAPEKGKSEIEFLMGCHSEAELNGSCRDGETLHMVKLAGYRILRHEVTLEDYLRFDPTHTQHNTNPKSPVADVDWYEAFAYAVWYGGNLPTEAQFEYAARAGTKTSWSTGNDSAQLQKIAIYDVKTAESEQARPVMSKEPNQWGLFDMYGNVEEWCFDWNSSHGSETQHNPRGSTTGTNRITRGGSYRDKPDALRSASRQSNLLASDYFHYLGFRVVLPADSAR